jgi:hypothetical protein
MLAALFLAEGWAEPVTSDEATDIATHPPQLIREMFPPYYNAPIARAFDRRSRPRGR